MPKEHTGELNRFLQPYPDAIREIVLWLREFVWDLYPNANELIYDNYNALALGWSLSDKASHLFCNIAVYSKYVHFGFYYGSQIGDPEKILLGKGNQYRYIIVKTKTDLPKTYIKKLLKEAYVYSLSKLKDQKQLLKGTTITKSISKIRRRPS
jgi:hypothetical protein